MRLIVESRNERDTQDFLNKVFIVFRDTMIAECGAASIAWSNLLVTIRVRVAEDSLVLNRSTSEEYRLSLFKDSGEKITAGFRNRKRKTLYRRPYVEMYWFSVTAYYGNVWFSPLL